MNKFTSLLLVTLLLSFLGFSFFSIKTAEATTIITPNGDVDPSTAPIQRDGDIYTLTGNIADNVEVQRSNIIIDGNGYTVQGSGIDSGITIDGYLNDANNVTLRNLRITDFELGIEIIESSYSTIYGNVINNTKLGIFVDSSSFNNISGNDITDPVSTTTPDTYGMQISGSSYSNAISSNEITNKDYGIYLPSLSYPNLISRNNITNSLQGIHLWSSNNILFYENIIADSQTAGFYFRDSSSNNTIFGNTITNSNSGLRFDPQSRNNTISANTIAFNENGVYFRNSTDNTFYENNFTNNTQHVHYEFPGFTNFFNSSYPVGGNFWSNYTGVDLFSGPHQNTTGSDAIGDTTHTIDAYNMDFYPLFSRFSSFRVSQWYRVNVISNSTIQDFAYIQDGTIRMHATNSSATQSSGFMRVTIPKGLIGPPYTVRVDTETPTTLNDTLYDSATTRWIYFAYPHSTREVTIQGVPDTTPPTVSVLSPQSQTYNTGDIPLTFTVNEPTSWLSYSLDGQNNITITGNTTILGLTDGLHTLIVYANDRAANDKGGNTGSSPTISFSIDTTQPIVQITSPENKTYGPRSIPLTFTVNEPVSWLRYSLDGQSNITITGDTTLSGLQHGPHTIVVYANDTAGNVGESTTVHFSVDATPPIIIILSPENKTYETRGLPLTFTLSESTSWIGYSLDSNVNATINGNTTITNLLNGTHTVVVYANDTFGNMGRSDRVYWTAQITSTDTTPPIIQIVSPENITYTTTGNTASAPLAFTVNEQVIWVAYSLDNAPNITITGNITLTNLPLGSHRIIIYALDEVGNAGASEIRYFTVQQPPSDRFPPTWLIIAVVAIIIVAIAIIVYYVRRRGR
jgi:parallel beta-helix repeat protein